MLFAKHSREILSVNPSQRVMKVLALIGWILGHASAIIRGERGLKVSFLCWHIAGAPKAHLEGRSDTQRVLRHKPAARS